MDFRTLTRSLFAFASIALTLALVFQAPRFLEASSHREAPMILNDPLADNTDVYAFRSPDNPNTVTIIANYIPLELPEGGPNYGTFGENIRYEIHIKNQTSVGALGSAKDDITYRFLFALENEDPSTFFNIRLGQQNLKATYTMLKSTDGGETFTTVLTGGVVPPNNIGPRSIEGAAGLNTTYDALESAAVMDASSGETVFVGPRDDPFFVDLGGIFDLGGVRDDFGSNPANADIARDAVAGFNTHAIALQIPIAMLQKDGKTPTSSTSILDGDFVIGVWASASRPRTTVLDPEGGKPNYSADWVQVSRLGMPLTNEAVIPIGDKDRWNATTPYMAREQEFAKYFVNPELGLYMNEGMMGDVTYFGGAVPGLADLRIQSKSYPALGDVDPDDGDSRPGLDFRNGQDGAFELTKIMPALDLSGSALAVPTAPAQPGLNTALIGAGEPRRIDVLPIFYFGVPNLIPYQLATGKTGGPLSAGKPFIHNFLPITQTDDGTLYGGDMLRLNMATPVTDRSSEEFKKWARQGLIRAAALGLTSSTYNGDKDLEFIPHMDGFPNGRRLEDDVTTIALQAVGGLVLAAVGLPFDDATMGDYGDLLSPQLVAELTFVAGPTKNDLALQPTFPYMASPHRGYDYVKQLTVTEAPTGTSSKNFGLNVPKSFLLDQNQPNPFDPTSTEANIGYHVSQAAQIRVQVYDVQGRVVATLVDGPHSPGTYTARWNAADLASGTYFYRIEADGRAYDVRQATLVK